MQVVELKLLRIKRGLTLDEIAKNLGYSKQAIYKIERGLFQPSAKKMLDYAKLLNISVEELVNKLAILESN